MIVDIRSVQLSLRDATTALVQCQPDYYGGGPEDEGEKAGGNSYPIMMPYGFMARPLDPSGPDAANLNACEALVIEGPDEGRLMPTTDPRYLTVIPDTGGGGSVQYVVTDDGTHQDTSSMLLAGTGLSGITAGSLFIRVPYAEGTKAHLIQVDLGTNKIRLIHGDGPGIEITTAGINFLSAPTVGLAGAAGQPVVIDPSGALAAWITAVSLALAHLGQPVTAPVGFTSTKATA